MTNRKTDQELDYLLSGSHLSGAERERILNTVLKRTRRGSPRRIWSALLLGGALTATASLAGLLLLPRSSHRESSGFTAKGSAAGAGSGPEIDVVCLGASLSSCPTGSTLMFVVRPAARDAFLAAWAQAESDGSRIWYFSADHESPQIRASEGKTEPLSRGIRLGPEHRPGVYRIEIAVSSRPLSEPELIAPSEGDVDGRRSLTMTVVQP
jgi:hypothetical protein